MAEVKKPRAQITISRIIDIESVTRYYKLQSASAAAPSKPTDGATIPSGWTKTEPAYQNGATNRLYFVDQTIMTNGSIYYSQISLSSSYEAAKEAWNKANNAQKTADGIANNIYIPGTVQINGGKIQAGSLDVSKILMGDPSNLSQLSEHTYTNLGWSSKSDEKEDYQVTFIQDLQAPVGDIPEYNLKVPVSFAYSGNPQGMKYLLTMDDYDIAGYTASTGKTESLKNQSYFSLSPKILYTKPATMQPYVKFENIASNTWVLSMPESMPMVKDFRFYMCIAKADGVPSGLTYITLSISNLRITKITDGSSITGIIKSTNYVEDSNGDCISGMMTNYSSGEIRTPNGRWDDDGLNINQLNATGGKIGAWVLDDGALYSERTGVFDGIKYTTMVKLSPLRTISDGEATLADYQYPIQIMEKGEVLFGISETGNIENKGLATLAGRWRFNAGRIISKIGLSMGAGGAGLILCDEDGKPVIWIQDENSNQTFRVDRDGTMYHNGCLIGEEIASNIITTTPLSNNTWGKTGAVIDLQPGVYVITGWIYFAKASSGKRGIRFINQNNNFIVDSQHVIVTNNDEIMLNTMSTFTATYNVSISLQGFQNSGSSLNIKRSILKAVRIA